MSNTTIRYQRLLELLPRVYASQPKHSRIARLLEAIAQSLGTYDDDLRRVLYDRWLALATGAKTDKNSLSALGHLGSLLHIYRLPARIEHNGFETIVKDDSSALEIQFKSNDQRRDALYDLIGSTNNFDQEKTYLAALFPKLSFECDDAESSTLTVSLKKTQQQSSDDTADDIDLEDLEDDEAQETDELTIFRSMLNPEPSELYRQRLRITAGVLVRGLVTRHAILSLAIADVGAWPCPKIKHNSVSDAAKALGITADMSTAYGISPAQARHCSACDDIKRQCPFAENKEKNKHQIIEAQLLENPVQRIEKTLPRQVVAKAFKLYSDSLWPDRPAIVLTLHNELSAETRLTIKSETTGEVFSYTTQTVLKTETQLFIFPQLKEDELIPFQSGENVSHHVWNKEQGQAHKVHKNDQNSKAESIDKSHFCYSPFSDLKDKNSEIAIRTPYLRSGENYWRIDVTKGNSEINTETALTFEVRLRWFIRRPFHFRLSLPKTDSLKQAELRGALQLLKQDLVRVRAAGVRTDLIFPDKPREEAHKLAAHLQNVSITGVENLALTEAEQAVFFDIALSLQETIELRDILPKITTKLSLHEPHHLQEQAQPFVLEAMQYCSEQQHLTVQPLQLQGQQQEVEQHVLDEGLLWISAIFADDDGVGGTFFDQSLFADELKAAARFSDTAQLGKATFM